MSESATQHEDGSKASEISSPELTNVDGFNLQSALDAELVFEAGYQRKLKALSTLYGDKTTNTPGLAVEAAEALNAVIDRSTFVNNLEFAANECEKFAEMCRALKETKRLQLEQTVNLGN